MENGKLLEVDDLSLFERKVYHFAMWMWMANHKKKKYEWPGWKLFAAASNGCFLCDVFYVEKLAIRFDSSVKTIGTSVLPRERLVSIYEEYKKSSSRLQVQPSNWSYRENFKNICMEIAMVRFKNQSDFFIRSDENLYIMSCIRAELYDLYYPDWKFVKLKGIQLDERGKVKMSVSTPDVAAKMRTVEFKPILLDEQCSGEDIIPYRRCAEEKIAPSEWDTKVRTGEEIVDDLGKMKSAIAETVVYKIINKKTD